MSFDDKYNEFVEKMKNENANIDYEKLYEAFLLAKEAHLGQYRKSGEDYIIHPIIVSEILYDLQMDSDTIIAGLLHDVVEDTLITTGDLEYIFGKTIANLVDGVTKLRNLPQSSTKHAENIRKMVIAMSQDIRIVIIKLADRLHNMRTLEFQSPEKQIEKSNETLEIFAPIAHRLGMSKLKSELEDISFKYLEPNEYERIKNYLSKEKENPERIINKLIEYLKITLKENDIKNFLITGRPKHMYSIYKKMNSKSKEFVDLTDLIAIRVLVDREIDCYAVLGIIHSHFKPLIHRFKDYISVPKPNGYKSIHTTIEYLDDLGVLQNVEIQIRTYEMHEIAENGVASHWKYKEKKTQDKNEKFYSDVKQLIHAKDEFAQKITESVLNETIFVLTPKDEVREISKDATVLDFAFLIHTQIGYKTIGAKINDKIVPLNTQLKNGDKIEILTSNNSKGPGKDWVNMVKLSSSKGKIRKWFNDQEFVKNAAEGIQILEKEFEKIGLKLKDVVEDPKFILFQKKYNLNTLDQLAFKIYEGNISVKQIIKKFEPDNMPDVNIEQLVEKTNSKRKSDEGIIIDGSDNTFVFLAKCCHPFPGDEIRSYVKTGKGIIVHKKNCSNLLNVIEHSPDREIDVKWDSKILQNETSNKFSFSFRIESRNKSGILLEIAKVINDLKIDLENINSIVKKDVVSFNIVIRIKTKNEFKILESNLLKIEGILDIQEI